MKQPSRVKWQLAILAVATLVSSAWAQQPGGAWTQSLIKARATVTAINPATRQVTIQGDQGPVTLSVGPDVKNFENLKVGDQVNISYYRGIGAQIVKGSKKVTDPSVSTFTSGNSPGMRPAGKAGASATVTVKVQDINLPTNTVAFTMSDGTTHIMEVKTPEMQQFLRELKRGDVVQVTFTDSIAVSVIPAS